MSDLKLRTAWRLHGKFFLSLPSYEELCPVAVGDCLFGVSWDPLGGFCKTRDIHICIILLCPPPGLQVCTGEVKGWEVKTSPVLAGWPQRLRPWRPGLSLPFHLPFQGGMYSLRPDLDLPAVTFAFISSCPWGGLAGSPAVGTSCKGYPQADPSTAMLLSGV